MSRINADPVNFTQPYYAGTGNFDLSSYLSISANTGKVAVLFFINIQSSASAAGWLSVLNALRSDTEVRPIAACYFHNSTAFQNLTADTPIANALSAAGLAGNEFPVCRIATGTVASQRLQDITGDTFNYCDSEAPAGGFWDDSAGLTPMMWGYIIDTRGKISDKWHAERINDPLAAALCLPSGTSFPSGNITSWSSVQISALTTAVATRCSYLSSPLTVLGVTPPESQILAAMPASIAITFSRPLSTAFAQNTSNWTIGGSGVVISSGGSNETDINPYVGKSFIENTLDLVFSDASLDDTAGIAMELSFTGLTAEGDSTPISDAVLSWTVDTHLGVPVVEIFFMPPPPAANVVAKPDPLHSNRPTLGYSDIQMELTFSEPIRDPTVPGGGALPFSITSAPGNSVTGAVASFAGLVPNILKLTFSAGNTGADGVFTVTLPAGSVQDTLGNLYPRTGGPDWTQIVAYDHESPAAVLDFETGGPSDYDTVPIDSVNVRISFDKAATIDTAQPLDCSITGGGSVVFDSVDGDVYVYTWNFTTPGACTLTVNQGAGTDFLSRETRASNILHLTYAPPASKDIVLVVDQSSSMGYSIEDPDGIPGSTAAKWAVMLPRIRKFLSELNVEVASGTVNGQNDRLGLVVYDTTTQQITFAGADWVIADNVGVNNSGPMETALAAVTPRLRTAMGSAIGEAYALLDARGANAGDGALILFADGEQNEGANISIDTINQQVHIGSPYNLTIKQGTPGTYPIHAVGITYSMSSGSGLLSNLEYIASFSGGTFAIVTEIDLDTAANEVFGDLYNAIYGGTTPVTIKRFRDVIRPGQQKIEIPFTLDMNTTGLMVSLSWLGSGKVSYQVKQNGKMLSRYGRSVAKDRYDIRALRLPHREPGPLLGVPVFDDSISNPGESGYASHWFPGTYPGGRHRPGLDSFRPVLEYFGAGDGWFVELSRNGGPDDDERSFFLNIVAEQSGPDHPFVLPGPPYKTLTAYDIPFILPEANLSFRPSVLESRGSGISLMNTLNNYAGQVIQNDPVTFLPELMNSGIAGKDALKNEEKKWISFETILRDALSKVSKIPEVDRALHTPRIETFDPQLYHTGKKEGLIRWRVPGFRYPGVYRLVARVVGSGKTMGRFERMVSRTICVTPGVDLARSVKSYTLDPRTREFEAQVVLQDAAGNLLGPGKALMFEACDHERGSLRVTDNLDGSYVVRGVRLKTKDPHISGFSFRVVERRP